MLSDLIAPTRRLALVGLAKNTGKTETLAAILRELAERKTCVGVTSIGRDGEAHDVIDARIEKPRIVLQAGSLVASTDALLRASGLAHEQLAQTGVRTPLGEVVIARLAERGAVEVAGPSAAEDLRAVSEAMLSLRRRAGADRRLDRPPRGLLAGGRRRARDRHRRGARRGDRGRSSRPRGTLSTWSGCRSSRRRTQRRRSASTDGSDASRRWSASLVLSAEPAEIAALLREHPSASTFHVEGALSERFLEGLLSRPHGAGRARAVDHHQRPRGLPDAHHGPG